MTPGREHLTSDLRAVLEGPVPFDVRARLEHSLLTVLREEGTDGVTRLLSGQGDVALRLDGDAAGADVRYVGDWVDGRRLVVRTSLTPHFASVNVTTENAGVRRPEPDSRHAAFYAIWEELLGIPDSAVADLDAKRKAVYLVGLLEAEVMNGGFGQYLANTEGVWVDETLACLARVGAERTRPLLAEADELRGDADSWVEVWESRAGDLRRARHGHLVAS